MSDSQRTQTDPLITLIAQQAALQVQIDRLIAQRATPPPSPGGRSSSASISASMNQSQRIPAIERLGGRRRRRRANRGHTVMTNINMADEGDEVSEEGESEETIPSPPKTHKLMWLE